MIININFSLLESILIGGVAAIPVAILLMLHRRSISPQRGERNRGINMFILFLIYYLIIATFFFMLVWAMSNS